MHSTFRAVSLGLICAVLASCGGGGGGGGAASAPLATAIAGVAVDGYIQGATVCLDVNLNQTCDVSEPSATTAAGGTFTLNIAGLTTAQVRAAHILIDVPSSAKDSDDAGQTLAQAGKSAYTLMAPANAYVSADGKPVSSAVVSPLTTLVSHDMIVGNGKPLSDAQNAVRTRLGLPSYTDLHQNFIANSNTALHTRAIVIANLIGWLQDGAKLVSGTSDRDAVFAALTYLQQNAARVQSLVDSDTSNLPLATKLHAIFTMDGVAPKYDELLIDARLTTATSSNISPSSIMLGGYYAIYCRGATCDSLGYSKTSGIYSNQAVQIQFDAFSQNAGSWVSDYSYLSPTSYSYAYTQDPTNIELTVGTNKTSYSARYIDLNILTPSRRVEMGISGSILDINYPSEAKMYLISATSNADAYTKPVDQNPLSVGGVYKASFANLEDLMASNLTSDSDAGGNHLMLQDISFTFDTPGVSQTSGFVTIWNDKNTTCSKTFGGYSCSGFTPRNYEKVGSLPYEIRSISGERTLVVFAQSRVKPDGYPIFFERNGVVLQGSMRPANVTGAAAVYFNRVATDAVATSRGAPTSVN